MKVQVKLAFKSYFLSLKSNKKADRLCMKFSSTSNTSVQSCLYLLTQNQCPHFLLSPLLFKEYLNPQVRINKMANKHTADYHPSPSQLTSRIHPLIFLWAPKGFISLEFFFNFFSKPVYSTMVKEKFQIYGVKITGNYICESKIESADFYLCPQAEGNHSPQAEGNYPFLPNSIF